MAFDDSTPIYLQIAEQIRTAILDGTLKEGDQVMSTTQYATTYRINPATAAKGLRYAVCRYNYGPDGEPELSTTMTDATRGFHNPPNWLVLGTKED